LHYSERGSMADSSLAPAANDGLQFSDYQKASALSEGTSCSVSSVSAADETLCTTVTDVVSVEPATVDAVSASSSSFAAAVADDDVCESLNSLYQLICCRLQSVDDADQRHTMCSSLTTLLQFFDAEYFIEDTSSSDTSPGFPLYLVEQYTKLIKDDVGFYSADG